jgi:hypothetical protein
MNKLGPDPDRHPLAMAQEIARLLTGAQGRLNATEVAALLKIGASLKEMFVAGFRVAQPSSSRPKRKV